MNDEQLAERVARSDWGDGWGHLTDYERALWIRIWSRKIEAIREAGLEIVEAEEGR